jgi:hypothetical protein
MKDEFEFVVFNNALPRFNPDMQRSIGNVCRNLGLRCIEVQQDQDLVAAIQQYEPRFPIFYPNGRYATDGVGNEYSLCWAWKHVISKETDMACLMHSDVFLISDLRPSEYLKEQGYDLCYIPQARPGIREYMWEMFVLFNMARLPQPETICWMGGFMGPNGTPPAGDTSCVTSLYLGAHRDLKVYHMPNSVFFNDPSVSFSTRPVYEVSSFGNKQTVLHYTSSTNWDHQTDEYHRTKTEWLRKVLARDEGVPDGGKRQEYGV